MAAFVAVLRDVGPAVVKFFPNVSKEDAHTIQIRSVDLAMLVRDTAFPHIDTTLFYLYIICLFFFVYNFGFCCTCGYF